MSSFSNAPSVRGFLDIISAINQNGQVDNKEDLKGKVNSMNRFYRKVFVKQHITYGLFFRLVVCTIALFTIGVMSAAAATNSVTIAVTADINTPDAQVVSDTILARPEIAAVLIAGDSATRKAGAFSGRQSHRGKSQSPVAWMTGRRETE